MVGVELKGDVITLPNSGAKLYFLGTNSRTAQGRTGNLISWMSISGRLILWRLSKLARPMAAQKQYRITYFSTPSSEAHAAYPTVVGQLNLMRGGRQVEHIRLDIVSFFFGNGGRLRCRRPMAANCDAG
jgi:hypothetical protein